MNARQNPMSWALTCAQQAARLGEVPVGAVIVRDGQPIVLAHNRTRTWCDPTAHAELLAIRLACGQQRVDRLPDCDLYVTLEPCAMCAQAIANARIRRLYYGASDPKSGGVESGARVFEHKNCHHRPEIYAGIGETRSAALLSTFFEQRR